MIIFVVGERNDTEEKYENRGTADDLVILYCSVAAPLCSQPWPVRNSLYGVIARPPRRAAPSCSTNILFKQIFFLIASYFLSSILFYFAL